MPNQTGGWSLTWQGTDNKNSDFPNGDTILSGIVAQAGAANVTYSADAQDVDVSKFDAVIAVIGETPYAEGAGDIGPSGTLRHSGRYPEDLAVLEKVAGKGKPVITVLVAGRPVYANDLLNLSDSFVMAWLPGTEGKGVADVLFKRPAPASPARCRSRGRSRSARPSLNDGDKDYAPLFATGYGLKYGRKSNVGKLDAAYPAGGCGVTTSYPVFNQADRATWPLYVASGAQREALGADLNRVVTLPAVKVETTPGQHPAGRQAGDLDRRRPASRRTAPRRPRCRPSPPPTARCSSTPSSPPRRQAGVKLAIGGGAVDATALFAGMAGKGKQTVKIPLACFVAKGADLARSRHAVQRCQRRRLHGRFRQHPDRRRRRQGQGRADLRRAEMSDYPRACWPTSAAPTPASRSRPRRCASRRSRCSPAPTTRAWATRSRPTWPASRRASGRSCTRRSPSPIRSTATRSA